MSEKDRCYRCLHAAIDYHRGMLKCTRFGGGGNADDLRAKGGLCGPAGRYFISLAAHEYAQTHPQPLISAQEAADLLGVSTTTLRRYGQGGLLPQPRRIGRTQYWRRSDVEALQAARRAVGFENERLSVFARHNLKAAASFPAPAKGAAE